MMYEGDDELIREQLLPIPYEESKESHSKDNRNTRNGPEIILNKGFEDDLPRLDSNNLRPDSVEWSSVEEEPQNLMTMSKLRKIAGNGNMRNFIRAMSSRAPHKNKNLESRDTRASKMAHQDEMNNISNNIQIDPTPNLRENAPINSKSKFTLK